MRPLTGSGRIARIGPSVIPTKLIEGATFPTGADDVIRIADKWTRVSQPVVTGRLADHLNFIAFRHSVVQYTRVLIFNYNIFIILIIIIITHIMDIARLITIVQEYEELYNLKHSHYSNQQRRDNIWEEIGKRLNQTGKFIHISMYLVGKIKLFRYKMFS